MTKAKAKNDKDVILRANNVHKAFMMGKEPLRVLRGASLEVRKSEFLAIMGASGSGKSTLLHILGALDILDEGSVVFDNRDIFSLWSGARDRIRNTEVGFVFQFYHLLPELTVLENIVFPAMIRMSVLGWMKEGKKAREKAAEIMKTVGLEHRMKHRPNELSGGERQRAAIARALVNEPRLLLADEPTGNLDAAMGRDILNVLLKLNEEGQTIVMVTHDPKVGELADRCVHLAEGQICN